MQYILESRKTTPQFDYLVKSNHSYDYYLFKNFNDALEQARLISIADMIACIYEVYFNVNEREFYTQNTFIFYDGKATYDKCAKVGLHLKWYTDSGKWLNPDVDLSI